jgi:hypothetical protein
MRRSRVITGILCAFAVALATPALAQTPQAPAASAASAAPAGRIGQKGQVGILVGASSVQNVGALLGAQAAFHVDDNIDIVAEGIWMQDTVTRLRLETAKTIAGALQTSQGKTATGVVDAPAYYGGIGVRYLLPFGTAARPYLTAGGGVARVVYRPAFTLGGADVTTTLATYGVTLGADITGEVTKPAFGGGFGLMFEKGKIVIDGGVRLLSIQTEGQKTNVLRAQLGIGIKF